MSFSAAGHSDPDLSSEHSDVSIPFPGKTQSQPLPPGTTLSQLLPSGRLLWTMRLLCLVALSVSGYLAWTAFQASEVYGCGGGQVFDCGHVLTSSWSKWFGIPVSVPAFGLYASLLAVLAFFRPGTPERLLSNGWKVVTAGGLSAGLAALWFIGIQVFALGHLCMYCLAAHTCGLFLAGIVIFRQPHGFGHLSRMVPLACTGLAILISGQYLQPEQKTFIIERHDPVSNDSPSGTGVAAADELFDAPMEDSSMEVFDAPDEDGESTVPSDSADAADSQPVDQSQTETHGVASNLMLIVPPRFWGMAQLISQESGNSETQAGDETQPAAKSQEQEQAEEPKPEAPKPEPRMISVSGKFKLDPARWPLLGKPDAKYVFVEMFDYTCPHCRNTHKAVSEAFKKYGDDLAVIALPVSVHGSCSESATSKMVPHGDSCELARLSIAIWRLDREKFHSYHDWLFGANRNRTVSEAKKHAESLVGAEALQKELDKKVSGQFLKKHGDLYKLSGGGSVPKLLFPKSTLSGEVGSGTTLISIIERELN
ncbi:MAG: thioredoxin domain-containing protein [Planctomyces sp.]|nr:thioredoxin domain-containing protein [Planctomyces sp.]